MTKHTILKKKISVNYLTQEGESYPDITLLPALANIFETSIDLLVGMDTIRAEET